VLQSINKPTIEELQEYDKLMSETEDCTPTTEEEIFLQILIDERNEMVRE